MARTDETTLYNAEGQPVAYMVDDVDSTIYLWEGTPVAYLHDENIYGFNGVHLGLFRKGIMYNQDGDAVGALKSPTMPQMNTMKSMKEMKPMKSMREMAPMRPMFSASWSEEDLKKFLLNGID